MDCSLRVQPLMGVLFPISTLEVAPAPNSEIFADRTMLMWSADDDVTGRPFGRLHTPISFPNTGRLQPPGLLICQTEIVHCHRRIGVTKGTHCTVPRRQKRNEFVRFLIQSVEASLDLLQRDSSVCVGVFLHVGVCFYMSASVCPCVSEKTDYENL